MPNLPAKLLNAQLAVNTSATPNTDVATQIVGNPAAGMRYRLWAVSANAFPSGTGLVSVQIQSAGGSAWARLAFGVGGSDWQEFPGGVTLQSGGASINALHRSNVASQSIRVQVYYTLEAV